MGDNFINILLIGESGVGKSTFINSFANYIKYDSLAAASESRLLCLIPTAFTLTDEKYVDRIVHFGFDGSENENVQVGKSSTQECRAYEFEVSNIPHPIRLIDTPGVGDARGVEQDEENIRKIAGHLQRYTHINAICFLLKPNVSVLGEYFKYCIDHLLSSLNGGFKNLIFVFTHSRSTFYRPGETLSVLQRLISEYSVGIPLSKENMFCLDNEAFRYGVALQHGFKFSEGELENFERSWGISAKSSLEILGYILENLSVIELKPLPSYHESMVNLNEFIKASDPTQIHIILYSNRVNQDVKNEMLKLDVEEIRLKLKEYFSLPCKESKIYTIPDYKSLDNNQMNGLKQQLPSGVEQFSSFYNEAPTLQPQLFQSHSSSLINHPSPINVDTMVDFPLFNSQNFEEPNGALVLNPPASLLDGSSYDLHLHAPTSRPTTHHSSNRAASNSASARDRQFAVGSPSTNGQGSKDNQNGGRTNRQNRPAPIADAVADCCVIL